PQEISNDLDEQQEHYQVDQLQGASGGASAAPLTPVYPHGYYPPDAGSGSPLFLEHLKDSRGLNHGRTARGAYERALVKDESLFVNDIEATRCVMLAPHQIYLAIYEYPEETEGPWWDLPRVGVPLATARGYDGPVSGRIPVLEMGLIKQLHNRLLFYVLDQRNLRIEFAHLIAKRQLHSVM
ncbi:Hypothetical protein PHPALM_17126, partial [Phytophthora palmivora]